MSDTASGGAKPDAPGFAEGGPVPHPPTGNAHGERQLNVKIEDRTVRVEDEGNTVRDVTRHVRERARRKPTGTPEWGER